MRQRRPERACPVVCVHAACIIAAPCKQRSGRCRVRKNAGQTLALPTGQLPSSSQAAGFTGVQAKDFCCGRASAEVCKSFSRGAEQQWGWGGKNRKVCAEGNSGRAVLRRDAAAEAPHCIAPCAPSICPTMPVTCGGEGEGETMAALPPTGQAAAHARCLQPQQRCLPPSLPRACHSCS